LWSDLGLKQHFESGNLDFRERERGAIENGRTLILGFSDMSCALYTCHDGAI